MHLLQTVGYPAIFLVAVLEAMCVPFPSEVTFGFTAALAAQGKDGFSLPWVIVVGVIGEVCGSIIAYVIGRTGGRAAVDRWGKYVLLTHKDLDRADVYMARRGVLTVVIGRMLPILRAFVSLVAGIGEMPVVRFVLATTVGTVLYGVAAASLGYALGASWHRIVRGFTLAGVVALVLVAAVVVLAVYHRWRAVKAHHAAMALTAGREAADPGAAGPDDGGA